MTSRRKFIHQGAAAGAGLALAATSSWADEGPEATKGPKLEGRIFKATKGGQKGGESAEAFFEARVHVGNCE